ncbi:AGE family epimerase/isomerase [bacterium]|nr:AGE family epimerase/isomerase [bacterium]
MKRRSFIGASAGTAAVCAGLGGCEAKPPQTSGKMPQHELSVPGSDGKLAGYTLEELRGLYRYDLFDDFLPFHDKFVVDHEYGGFMVTVDRDGTRLSTEKRTWYLGRGIWVYSFLYNKVDKNQKFLDIASKAVDFTLKNKPKGESRFPEAYSREGKPLSGPETRVYGDLFVANGLSEYSKAVGDDTYWNMAKDIMLQCLKIYDSPDYPPAGKDIFGWDPTKTKDADVPLVVPAPRIQGHWMLLMRLGTQMLEFKADPEVEAVIGRSVDAVLNHHYSPEFRLDSEVLNHDMTRPAGDCGQYVDMGHCTETSWMIMFEALRRKDKTLFDTAADRFRRHVEVAWDDVYGGALHTLVNVDRNEWSVFKAQYLHAEILIGALCIIEHTGAGWAKDLFGKTYTYVREKFPLKQYGFPLWIDYADRKVTFERHASRAENFHHPRHLMLNLLAIERMIGRGGKVSDVFSA